MNTNYALIGAAGYIAPRHLKAMRETQGNLLLAHDIHDSVGILDRYFPKSDFFNDFSSFENALNKINKSQEPCDYVSICSPNYLHYAHIAATLLAGSHAICEKPLVLHPEELDQLQKLEAETGKKVFTILQLRLHPAIIKLKEKVATGPKDKIYDINLSYITSRGKWYLRSWKGVEEKSGGIASNIGIHFYDMLMFIFGKLTKVYMHYKSDLSAAGYLEFERARVRWMLSIDAQHLPKGIAEKQTTYRSITIDGEEIEFSHGFTDLHTSSYQDILQNGGFGIEHSRPSIALTDMIGKADIELDKGEHHPLALKSVLS